MLDVVIRSAVVIDGTGSARRNADVGIRDGVIVQVGSITEDSREVVDAEGLVLAPGFIDVHTHYDAQVFWDSAFTPSPLHGVTTVISGNCGFTLAPLHASDVGYLSQMLARVEGMPRAALESGLAWDWSSVAEYLDAVEARGVSLNVGFLAGHSTLRRHVMGERSFDRATEADRAGLAQALDAALDAGALGLSTSNSSTHSDEHQQPVPSRFADELELLELARVLRDRPGTLLQCVPPSGPYSDETKDRLVALSLAADRPVNWNVIVVNSASGPVAENRLEASERAAAQGACVTGLVFPTLNRLRVNFESGFFIDTIPGWAEIFRLPPAERVHAFADPEVRRELRTGAALVRPDQAFLTRWDDYEITDLDYAAAPVGATTVGELARQRDRDGFDTLLDLVVEYGLRIGMTIPADADDDAGWALRARLSADPRMVVGGSDAGAHMDMMCGATYTTSMLAQFPRRGLLELEAVVRLLTDAPAQLYGLRDRGRIQPGYRADLVAFDPDSVGPARLGARRDLPGECARVFAAAEGISRVWVNGVQVVADGTILDAKPGRVLRRGIDTVTVDNRRALDLTS